ncbi:hypothetical protein SVIOM342S_00405 [Streptomyces violaceorubidus]
MRNLPDVAHPPGRRRLRHRKRAASERAKPKPGTETGSHRGTEGTAPCLRVRRYRSAELIRRADEARLAREVARRPGAPPAARPGTAAPRRRAVRHAGTGPGSPGRRGSRGGGPSPSSPLSLPPLSTLPRKTGDPLSYPRAMLGSMETRSVVRVRRPHRRTGHVARGARPRVRRRGGAAGTAARRRGRRRHDRLVEEFAASGRRRAGRLRGDRRRGLPFRRRSPPRCAPCAATCPRSWPPRPPRRRSWPVPRTGEGAPVTGGGRHNKESMAPLCFPHPAPGLTPAATSCGWSPRANRQIAEELFISPRRPAVAPATSSPSSASPAAVRRRRWPTGWRCSPPNGSRPVRRSEAYAVRTPSRRRHETTHSRNCSPRPANTPATSRTASN